MALPGKIDQYNGIILDSKQLPLDINEFEKRLEESIKIWKEEGRRGLWIHFDLHQSHLIPTAAKLGFTIHHAQKEYVTMTSWIAPEISKIPGFATHYIGVGAVVVNEKEEILVVTEKFPVVAGKWKIPGGLVDDGEDIATAACREALEETGIRCGFVSVLAFREMQKYQWGKSDMYFVCRLKPLSSEIHKEESEIEDCKWMPLKEFYTFAETSPLQKSVSRLVVALLEEEKNGGQNFEQFYSEDIPDWRGKQMNKFFRSRIIEETPLGSPF